MGNENKEEQHYAITVGKVVGGMAGPIRPAMAGHTLEWEVPRGLASSLSSEYQLREESQLYDLNDPLRKHC